ncbi:transcription-repair coupling factor [Rhodopila sp.]|jgi:transcription-repair coupling factor (superfamily II helicase)|uniref:transcription-repair coupling factor n=1 Tax=Rhodopila sp. TaxID=2480087 RepID=UPI002C097782|nr:transcription-repair coupling factor [Rhodopila sp.]HVZ10083.1 transcription-repair coupling factor [Rhodopila sp.]
MSEPVKVWGAPEGWDAFLLARRRREHAGSVLHVTRDDARMARLAEALSFVMPEAEVLRFPAWDCLPYDRVSPNPAILSERIATLARLLEPSRKPRIVLTTVNALVQRIPPRAAFAGASTTLTVNGTVQPETLAAFLEANGYGRAGTVMEPGEYAMRGGIIDIFPAGESEPVRLDLFGDTIESIRAFDPSSQRSAGRRSALSLRPVSEVPLGKESIARFRSGWRELFGQDAAKDPIYLSVSDGRRHPGMEHWVPLFHPTMENLLDYLPDAAVSLDHQADEVLEARLEMIADHFQARKGVPRDGEVPYRPLPPSMLYLDRAGWDEMLSFGPLLAFTPFVRPDGAGGVDGGGRPGPVFAQSGGLGSAGGPGITVFDQLRAQAERWAAEGRRLVIAAWTRGSRARLANLLGEHGFQDVAQEDDWATIRRKPAGAISLIVLGVERGFVAERLALVGEQDLLGERISRPPRRRKRADQFIAEATEIAEGDLVVHQEYGIGRYDGLATLQVSGAPHDCLRLIYDGDEKLFLPVENIEVLSRYGSEHQGTALDKLGGTAWQNRKARMKQRIRDMAGALIRIAAERKVRDAEMMTPAEGSWDEFCARFPFAETDDQARAIADVLEDLASGRPMDRLICGDVGFGKTEVALRAAFVAAMSGSQVAVVVPTTLLSRQHFRTFSARFAGLPVKVAQLSRMVTAKEAAEVKRGIASGEVNIVVGTHALLAKGVEFADLGLLVIDEEQHFGVSHKERLKALKADVHVLTLTATPIPRTLQLALTGVREMSIISTPPVDRLAVRTFIMPFDHVVIREALQRERFRGGQVFCVVPRIEDLARMADRLREIVPEARTVQAHGRLAPTELERVMTEFSDGKHDILLSTNIVESGLDMPAVNTLVIHRADMFGLGQLYQLRGRVGRGKQRGYAYLTWPPSHRLSAAAEKRLTVMQTLDALGAGFTLASHDLDIRGAGNLLGDEQSGHIKEVGIELYQQMLEDAVADLRVGQGKRAGQERDWTPNISLGLPVLIPETYVADLPVRLGLYRRIGALASDAETDAMAAELVDRFGPLPEEVDNLLGVVALKRACREAGVEKLEAGPKGMVVSFRGNAFSNPAGLVRWLSSKGGMVRLRPDHKLAISRDMDVKARLKFARDTLGALDHIARQAKAA